MRNYSLNNGDPVTQFGPIDVQVVAFPGSNFTGAIAPALRKVVEKGTINIVDLAFITKTADGVVEILELSDLSTDAKIELEAAIEDVHHQRGGDRCLRGFLADIAAADASPSLTTQTPLT